MLYVNFPEKEFRFYEPWTNGKTTVSNVSYQKIHPYRTFKEYLGLQYLYTPWSIEEFWKDYEECDDYCLGDVEFYDFSRPLGYWIQINVSKWYMNKADVSFLSSCDWLGMFNYSYV